MKMQAGEERVGGGGGGQLETVSQGCQHTQAPLALDSHSGGKLHISNISTLVPSFQCTLHCGCVEVHINNITTVHTATHCIIALQSWTNVGTRWNKSRTKRRQSGLCQSLTSKKSTCQLVKKRRLRAIARTHCKLALDRCAFAICLNWSFVSDLTFPFHLRTDIWMKLCLE